MTKQKPRQTTKLDTEIGLRIMKRRLLIDMSQIYLGEKIGVTYQQIQKYERGENRLPAGRLSKVADTLGVSVGYLLGNINENDPAAFVQLVNKQNIDALAANLWDGLKSDRQKHAIIQLMETFQDNQSIQPQGTKKLS